MSVPSTRGRAKAAKLAKGAQGKAMAVPEGAGVDTAGDADVQWLAQRLAERPTSARFGGKVSGGHVALSQDGSSTDSRKARARLCRTFGSSSFAFVDRMVTDLANAPGIRAEEAVAELNTAIQFIAEQKPQSELETLLLVQAWQAHCASLRLQRAMAKAEFLPHLQVNGALAAKLGNLFVRQVEALAKLRAAGKQVIEVKHIHVHGNAVVGNVNAALAQQGGGGGSRQNEAQPHATSAIQDMRSEDAIWPVLHGFSGDREEALSDAWRSSGKRRAGGPSERGLQARGRDQRGDRPAPRAAPTDQDPQQDARGVICDVIEADGRK